MQATAGGVGVGGRVSVKLASGQLVQKDELVVGWHCPLRYTMIAAMLGNSWNTLLTLTFSLVRFHCHGQGHFSSS